MRTKFNIFWVRLTNWEYWPWYIVYIPIFAYWLWCGIKTRAIFWISAVNPGFEYGGIIGASKRDIISKLPATYIPLTVLIKTGSSMAQVHALMRETDLQFPIIAKPDIGERGFNVELINNINELKTYLSEINQDVLLQDYLDMPIELGVFYYRYPNQRTGHISSIVRKEMLKVKGDGISTVGELMALNTRAAQQINRLKTENKIDLNRVLTDKEELLLEPIGNHVRGTTFHDANDLITEKLITTFNALAFEMEGFYYGRFDLRCTSIEELNSGKFKVMEVNGAASEPAHIYSPNYPILKGYKELFKHWKVLYKISVLNHNNGTEYMPFRVGWQALKKSRFMH